MGVAPVGAFSTPRGRGVRGMGGRHGLVVAPLLFIAVGPLPPVSLAYAPFLRGVAKWPVAGPSRGGVLPSI